MAAGTSIVRDRARSLRKASPDAELRLWRLLRNRALQQFKFRRQHPIAPYIVDFICLERKLVIELDGSQHMHQVNYDQQRTKTLERAGYRVIRFWDSDVLTRSQSVLQAIYRELGCPSP
jgi:very-short-patch-repair endonuclease